MLTNSKPRFGWRKKYFNEFKPDDLVLFQSFLVDFRAKSRYLITSIKSALPQELFLYSIHDNRFLPIKTMEENMKSFISFITLLSILITDNGCKKEESNPVVQAPVVVASEEWIGFLNDDSSWHITYTLEEYSNGSITASGLICFPNQGTSIGCPFSDGTVTVLDSVVKFTAHGTAVNPAAQSGSQTSRFTLSTNGVAIAGTGHGTYTINFFTEGWPSQMSGTYTTARTKGRGITFGDVTVKKPNIYIYPPTRSTVSVTLEFPMGGGVTESIPAYGEGWNVEVEPSGRIGGKYDYLFYESSAPDRYQYTSGWIVEKGDLTAFFRKNLSETGFNEKESQDFIDYWIPRLNGFSRYIIYPQYAAEIEKVIRLKVDKRPDSVLRLFYVIKGTDEKGMQLSLPVIPKFTREGFVVTEWGVVVGN